ncbi:MAG: carboxynorspermidine decarboxylase [Saprospiraceae bacterium]|nr:carboxynorspermidine decarboxylase [Saprospiraceae bacterium]
MNINNYPSPAYILEEELLIQNLELLQSVSQQAGINIILALKGFSMWSTFPLVAKYLHGATASSLYETRLIREEMGLKAHTYVVAYRQDEFAEIAARSSHMTFNSIAQWERFKDQVPAGVSCGLRVNPGYSEVEVDLYNPAAPGSRLGEPAEAFANGWPEGLEGIHFHVLCESSSYDLEKVLEVFEASFGPYLHKLKWVNMGGGHLMTRKGYDTAHLVKLLSAFREKYDVEVILEPGSAIAWETGFLLAQVLDIHESGGIKTAILDVSFTAHMPDTLEMPYRPRIRGAMSEVVPGKPTYRLGGTSCLAGDYMEAYSFEHPLAVGDRLILEDMIHYTMVKTTMFNGVAHPDICILRKSGALELVRRFNYEDFKGRLS